MADWLRRTASGFRTCRPTPARSSTFGTRTRSISTALVNRLRQEKACSSCPAITSAWTATSASDSARRSATCAKDSTGCTTLLASLDARVTADHLDRRWRDSRPHSDRLRKCRPTVRQFARRAADDARPAIRHLAAHRRHRDAAPRPGVLARHRRRSHHRRGKRPAADRTDRGRTARSCASAPEKLRAAARERRLVVVETTTLDVNRGEPAASYIRTALAANAHVITANKGPVACAYAALRRAAERADRRWLFEGAVMDGVPVFNLVRETLPAVRITRLPRRREQHDELHPHRDGTGAALRRCAGGDAGGGASRRPTPRWTSMDGTLRQKRRRSQTCCSARA